LNIFCILIVKKNTFKVVAASMKTLTGTNFGDFTGSRIRISYSEGTSTIMGNLNSAFEKADSQSSDCDFSKVILIIFYHHLRLAEQFTENHRRLPEWRNKHFDEGFSKDLQN
jgi:hypothetical protein